MDTTRIKLAGAVIATAAVAAGGGYGWARMASQPEIVEIGSIACGVPPQTARFGLPLKTVMATTGGLPFGIGPVEVPAGGGTISLRFDPATDGTRREVRLVGATLYLPFVFGHDAVAPKRITINCRDGVIGSVRYQGADRASATFSVVHEAAGALLRTQTLRADAPAPPPARRLDAELGRPQQAGIARHPPGAPFVTSIPARGLLRDRQSASH